MPPPVDEFATPRAFEPRPHSRSRYRYARSVSASPQRAGPLASSQSYASPAKVRFAGAPPPAVTLSAPGVPTSPGLTGEPQPAPGEIDDYRVDCREVLQLPHDTRPAGEGGIRCVARCGEYVWSGENNGDITVRHGRTGQLKRTVPKFKVQNAGSQGFVWSLLLVRDCVWAGSSNGRIAVFDAASVERIDEMIQHSGGIYCLLLHDWLVYSGSSDFTIVQWDAHSRQKLQMFPGHTGGVRCILGMEQNIISGAEDKSIRVWDVERGQPIKEIVAPEFGGHTGSVLSLVYTYGNVWSASDDATVRVWNSRTWELLRVLHGHYGRVCCLCAVGAKVWSGGADCNIVVWDALTLNPVHTIQAHTGYVTSVCQINKAESYQLWSVASDRSLRFWDVLDRSVCDSSYAAQVGLLPGSSQPESSKARMLFVQKENERLREQLARLRENEGVAPGSDEKTNAQIRERVKHKQLELDRMHDRVAELEAQLQHQTEAFNEASQTIDELRARQVVMTEELSAARPQAERMAAAERERAAAVRECELLRKDMARAKAALADGIAEREALHRKSGVAEVEVAMLKKEKTDWLDERRVLQLELQQTLQHNQQLKDALRESALGRDEGLGRVSVLQGELEALQKANESLNGELNQLREKLSREVAQKESNAKELESLSGRASTTDQELSMAKQEAEVLRSHVSSRQTEVERLIAALQEQNTRISALEDQRVQSVEETAELRGRATLAETEKHKLQEELGKLRAELLEVQSAHSKTNEELQQRRQSEQEETASRRSKVELEQAALNRLRAELDAVRTERDHLKVLVQSGALIPPDMHSARTERDYLTSELAKSRAENERLQRDLIAITQQLRSAPQPQSPPAEAPMSHDELVRQLATLHRTVEALEKERTSFQREREALRKLAQSQQVPRAVQPIPPPPPRQEEPRDASCTIVSDRAAQIISPPRTTLYRGWPTESDEEVSRQLALLQSSFWERTSTSGSPHGSPRRRSR